MTSLGEKLTKHVQWDTLYNHYSGQIIKQYKLRVKPATDSPLLLGIGEQSLLKFHLAKKEKVLLIAKRPIASTAVLLNFAGV